MTSPTQDDPRATYLGLRLAMPVLVLLLAVGIGARFAATGCLQPSISAYFYSPLRSLFVAALCAIGTCLIIYRGRSDRENALLNLSGVMAFVVAFEPTEIGPGPCEFATAPEQDEILEATYTNVLALIVVGLVAVLVAAGLAVWTGVRMVRPSGSPPPTSPDDSSASVIGALGVAIPIVLVAVFFFADFEFFTVWAHLGAAVLLFVGVVAVVLLNCFDDATSARAKRVYALLAVGMAAAASLLFVDFRTHVFWTESLLIALFAVYWVVQTVDLERRRPTPPQDRGVEDLVAG
ncbi:hypothetical protein WCD74_01545 [Actinomycetospora sp. OC33-EN08]|uniref:DUF998 domain-containing protein n=1 Tax=Actinomycetospora aurantiaca TaxID=3129233 RepID=A0ABU8MHM2_9PSEU